MTRIRTLFLLLTIIGPMHMGEQLLTRIDEFYSIREFIGGYYAWFDPAAADHASVLLVTIVWTLVSVLFYSLLHEGWPRLIVPAIFGVGNAASLGVAVAFLVLFGVGWGFFDGNNMPILSQIVRPRLRATGYGIMNLVSISCGGLADWGFGSLRDRGVPLNVIFGVFGLAGLVSIALVLLIRPDKTVLASSD